jgi:hypothetical protein
VVVQSRAEPDYSTHAKSFFETTAVSMRRILLKAWGQVLPAQSLTSSTTSSFQACRFHPGVTRLFSQTIQLKSEETLGKLNPVDPAVLANGGDSEDRSTSGSSASTSEGSVDRTSKTSAANFADPSPGATGADPVDSGLVGDDGIAAGGAGGQTVEVKSPGILRGASGFQDVVIVAMARTPIGTFGGSFSSWSAPKLGGTAISGLHTYLFGDGQSRHGQLLGSCRLSHQASIERASQVPNAEDRAKDSFSIPS